MMEPVAIIGLGCRFPKAPGVEEFWNLLRDGTDAITEVPANRWDAGAFYCATPRTPGKMVTKWGGFLDDVDGFDPLFFRIMPIEAGRIDPQHRLAMEVAWEAIESAGIDPTHLAYSHTGVYLGVSHSDHDRLLYVDRSRIDGYNGPNTYHCFAANRISFFLNLRGPSMAVDTACSSSLVAIHLACQGLRSGETDLALAGGVNLNLTPDEFIALSFLGVLSPGGRCRTFDAAADGYGRSEGCGIAVLKRLADAERDGDAVLAVIRGSAVNQDGLSNGITAPNGSAQEEVMRKALQVSGVSPHEIDYVEAQGTATALGDAIEAVALKAVYGPGRPTDKPLWLGSVKANLGHAESASGMASLLKVVLALRARQIPVQPNFQKLSPRINLDGTSFAIPTEAVAWHSNAIRRKAAVSAFGFGGTNAHMLLEAPEERTPDRTSQDREAHLLVLSAKTPGALADLAGRYVRYFERRPDVPVRDVCFTAAAGRAHFEQRLAVTGASAEDLSRSLRAFLDQQPGPEVHVGTAPRKSPTAPPMRAALLSELAANYVRGTPIDWLALHRGASRRLADLPAYPFQRHACRFQP